MDEQKLSLSEILEMLAEDIRVNVNVWLTDSQKSYVNDVIDDSLEKTKTKLNCK